MLKVRHRYGTLIPSITVQVVDENSPKSAESKRTPKRDVDSCLLVLLLYIKGKTRGSHHQGREPLQATALGRCGTYSLVVATVVEIL